MSDFPGPAIAASEQLRALRQRVSLTVMATFRTSLIILWAILAGYTAVVISRHGLGLLPIFFGDIGKIGWPGQFKTSTSYAFLLCPPAGRHGEMPFPSPACCSPCWLSSEGQDFFFPIFSF